MSFLLPGFCWTWKCREQPEKVTWTNITWSVSQGFYEGRRIRRRWNLVWSLHKKMKFSIKDFLSKCALYWRNIYWKTSFFCSGYYVNFCGLKWYEVSADEFLSWWKGFWRPIALLKWNSSLNIFMDVTVFDKFFNPNVRYFKAGPLEYFLLTGCDI